MRTPSKGSEMRGLSTGLGLTLEGLSGLRMSITNPEDSMDKFLIATATLGAQGSFLGILADNSLIVS